MQHRIALSHASGIVAEAILEKLPESGVTPDSIVLLDDESRAGVRLPFAGSHLKTQDQRDFDYAGCALLLLTEHDDELEAMAQAQGCLVISHALSAQEAAPLFVAGGDQPRIAYSETRLRLVDPELACLLPALRQLDRLAPLERINLMLAYSAEFRGKAGIDELAAQTVNLLNAREASASVFPAQIAFNLLPESAAARLAADLHLILGNSSYTVTLQTLNVPVFHGFAAAVQLEFASDIDIDAVREQLSKLENMRLKDGLASPIFDCNQSFSCVISHLEQTPAQPSCLQFWMIADPMRYGLANNYVNVTDFLLKSFL